MNETDHTTAPLPEGEQEDPMHNKIEYLVAVMLYDVETWDGGEEGKAMALRSAVEGLCDELKTAVVAEFRGTLAAVLEEEIGPQFDRISRIRPGADVQSRGVLVKIADLVEELRPTLPSRAVDEVDAIKRAVAPLRRR